MSWNIGKVIEATQGVLLKGAAESTLTGISTDTRLIHPGDCFVALSGERFDAHDFIPNALTKGIAAVVVSRPLAELNIPAASEIAVIRVPDTLYALGELARYRRNQYSIPVVGVTGSNGKTSSKEMLAGILSKNRNVLKNHGNFNNLIGVPLTLLSLDPAHQAAVVEMGINVPGEMERLAAISRPTVGLITNIHPVHLEGLQSVERILSEKGKLWESLDSEALAVVNLDDELLRGFAANVRARQITYSLHDPSADVRLAGTVEMKEGISSFRLNLGNETIQVNLPVLGLHQAQNAVAAAAVAWGMGESPQTIALGLSMHQPVQQRMQIHHLDRGCVLVDDSYNANPRSMIAAVQAIIAGNTGKPVVAILGEMKELGPESASLHRVTGRRIASLGISGLVTLGELGKEILLGAQDAGMSSSQCLHALTHQDAVTWILEKTPENAWVLVKGSRAMAMERIVEGILKNSEQ
ncbi:MAG: UDP-N-acetylmuramoyl-tripeptide--D-alanyl-D-alanine ligase [Syntrophobacteraceae bacterium]